MTETVSPKITALYRYPVKGLTGEPLQSVTVREGATFPADRIYAIENGSGKFDPLAPKHLPKINFLMLMRDEKLATLTTRFDDTTHKLAIERNGRQVVEGDLTTPTGRSMIEQFMAAFMGPGTGRGGRGAPKIVTADGHTFSDVPAHCVHIINLESLRDLERVAGRAIHPLRFRANIYVDGLPAWSEFKWLDKRIQLGPVTMRVWSRTQRCDAVNVDPETGARDLSLPSLLQRTYGHQDVGIYASVAVDGTLSVNDPVTLRN